MNFERCLYPPSLNVPWFLSTWSRRLKSLQIVRNSIWYSGNFYLFEIVWQGMNLPPPLTNQNRAREWCTLFLSLLVGAHELIIQNHRFIYYQKSIYRYHIYKCLCFGFFVLTTPGTWHNKDRSCEAYLGESQATRTKQRYQLIFHLFKQVVVKEDSHVTYYEREQLCRVQQNVIHNTVD